MMQWLQMEERVVAFQLGTASRRRPETLIRLETRLISRFAELDFFFFLSFFEKRCRAKPLMEF